MLVFYCWFCREKQHSLSHYLCEQVKTVSLPKQYPNMEGLPHYLYESTCLLCHSLINHGVISCWKTSLASTLSLSSFQRKERVFILCSRGPPCVGKYSGLPCTSRQAACPGIVGVCSWGNRGLPEFGCAKLVMSAQ